MHSIVQIESYCIGYKHCFFFKDEYEEASQQNIEVEQINGWQETLLNEEDVDDVAMQLTATQPTAVTSGNEFYIIV